MGRLVMRRAAQLAIDKARATGIGWVGARMSNHASPAALYATLPLQHDMIGLYVAVGSNNHLPPWGGGESLLGTNPLAVAVPALEEPAIVLDMRRRLPPAARCGSRRSAANKGRLDDRSRRQAAHDDAAPCSTGTRPQPQVAVPESPCRGACSPACATAGAMPMAASLIAEVRGARRGDEAESACAIHRRLLHCASASC